MKHLYFHFMQVSLDIIVALLGGSFVAVPLTWYRGRQKNNTDSVKAMSDVHIFSNQYKDRMNEVVAELEIVKKTSYGKTVQSSMKEFQKSYTMNYQKNIMN
jgi:hypothetical protein